MSTDSDKPIAKPSSAGSKSISTKYDASGTMLPVVHPVDIVYLCHKMEAAQKNPFIAKDGYPRYQRQVTKWIRQDAVNFGYQFPYCGEVGYNWRQYHERYRFDERGKKIHLYRYRQQFYSYFTPGEGILPKIVG